MWQHRHTRSTDSKHAAGNDGSTACGTAADDGTTDDTASDNGDNAAADDDTASDDDTAADDDTASDARTKGSITGSVPARQRAPRRRSE